MINRDNSRAGFTLVELIISGVIILLVSVTVYSVFSGGISVWKKTNQAKSKGYALRLAAEKMDRELRNSFKHSAIPFEGAEDSFYFAGLSDEQVSRIGYFLDEEDNFCRRCQNYSEIFEKGENGKVEQLIPHVKKLKCSYSYLDNASGEYKWKDEWVKGKQDTLPQAVEIELTFEGPDGQETKFVKTVFIPVGTGEQKIELAQ